MDMIFEVPYGTITYVRGTFEEKEKQKKKKQKYYLCLS